MSEGTLDKGVYDTTAVFVRAFDGGVEAESKVCGFNEDLGREAVFVAVYHYVEKRKLLVFFYLMCEVEGGIVFKNVYELRDVFFTGSVDDVINVTCVKWWFQVGMLSEDFLF